MDVFKQVDSQNFANGFFQESDEYNIKTMLKAFILEKNMPFENGKQKSAKTSVEKMDEGKKLFENSSSSTFELLKIYSQAIAHAPNDSVELARAYGNRSAILCNARLYEDSLKDIDRAIALDYPGNLKAKLFARKAKNLLALGPKHRLEAEKAIAEAHLWMEKINDVDKNFQESQLKKLNKQMSFEKPFEKPDNSCIVPDIIDPNKQLTGASKAIELKYSEKFGRHFVATRDIRPGEILIKEKAYVLLPPKKLYYANCWNCSKRAWASIPCKNCANVVFCDENCRDEAWINFHDIECPTISMLSREKLGDPEIMGIRLTIKSLKEAGSIASLKEKLEAIDSISDPFIRGFTGEKFDGSKYTNIYTLSVSASKIEQAFRERLLCLCAKVLFAWVETTRFFGEKSDNPDELVSNELVIFIGKLFMRNVIICVKNSFESNYYQLHRVTVEVKDIDVGSRLSCLISYFNHSCDSNASLVHSGDVMGIRSIQRIRKDEQIFICYGYSYSKLSTPDRRKILNEKFDFRCECNACNGNWRPNSEFSSFMNRSLSREVKHNVTKALILIKKHFKGESDVNKIMHLLSTDSYYVPFLSELLDTLCKNVDYPCQEICSHKELLRGNLMYNSY